MIKYIMPSIIILCISIVAAYIEIKAHRLSAFGIVWILIAMVSIAILILPHLGLGYIGIRF